MSPNRPSSQVMKGAFVVGTNKGPPKAIIFQYNPTTLTRNVSANTPGQGENNLGSLRLSGPPSESIDLDVEIDATDQLDQGSKQAENLGIHPQLAALESLLYPPSSKLKTLLGRLAAGEIEVIPPSSPLVLFVWGSKRVLPVNVESFNITEQEYDGDLNPIRAEVSLNLDVLTTRDFSSTHPGYHIHMAHHVFKEAMANVAQANDLSKLGNVLPGS